MSKKTIITIVSTITTIIVIAIATICIIYRNNTLQKTAITGNNINDNEPIEESTDNPEEIQTDNPEEVQTDDPTSKPKKNPSQPKYYIKVNNQMNTVTIYGKDEKGEYTKPVKAMVCSTGRNTPKNSKYKTLGKWTWGKMFGGVYTQWETHITGDILFHSVPYFNRYDAGSLEYLEYNKLGTTCSAGCVRLTCADSLWIYNNCELGTWVEFYNSPNPGPLGKPSAPKIPIDSPYRGWDPTDSNPANPWKNVILDVPSPEPSTEPTVEPTEEPTVKPSTEPTVEPTEEPTVKPSSEPTAEPTEEPTVEPSTEPNTESTSE